MVIHTTVQAAGESPTGWDAFARHLGEILGCEAAGRQPDRNLWLAAEAAGDRIGIDLRDQLLAMRGHSDSPDGRHSPFSGERCFYCYGNQLDVALYNLDADACPGTSACCSDHPDRDSYAYCQREPGHTGPHRYTAHQAPEGHYVDGDWVPAAGPVHEQITEWVEPGVRTRTHEEYRVIAEAAEAILAEYLTAAGQVFTTAGHLAPPTSPADVVTIDDLPLDLLTQQLTQRVGGQAEQPRDYFTHAFNAVAAPWSIRGPVVIETNTGLVATLLNGPDLEEIFASLRETGDIEATARRLYLHPYAVHQALVFADTFHGPLSFEVPHVIDAFAHASTHWATCD